MRTLKNEVIIRGIRLFTVLHNCSVIRDSRGRWCTRKSIGNDEVTKRLFLHTHTNIPSLFFFWLVTKVCGWGHTDWEFLVASRITAQKDYISSPTWGLLICSRLLSLISFLSSLSLLRTTTTTHQNIQPNHIWSKVLSFISNLIKINRF